MLIRELLGIPIFVIVPGVAVTTGCGGGGLIVPTCMYLLSMTPKEATALSQALMFGAACASMCVDWNSKESNFNVPLIDVQLLLFMGPSLMAGAMVGGFVNRSSPNWFIITALVVVLSISGFKTLHKGYKARIENKEKADTIRSMSQMELGDAGEFKSAKDGADVVPASATKETNLDGEFFEEKTDEADNAGATDSKINIYKVDKRTEEEEEKYQKYFDEEAPKINLFGWGGVFTLWIFNIFVLVVRGSPKNESFVGLKSGSWGYWGLTVFAIVFLWSLGIFFGKQLEQRTRDADPKYVKWLEDKYYGTESPKKWSFDEIYFLSPAIFFAGIISGTVGIGGGMILGPLMLMVEIPAQVVASVNTTSIILSASTLTALYIIDDAVDPDYALFYSACCFCGAYIGKSKTKAYFAKNDFVLVYLLAGIILSSWALVFIKVVEEIQVIKDDGWEGFTAPA